MFDSPWLDIATGVVFVWFFGSLAVSALNEMIVRVLAMRSKQLWLALNQMLDGGYEMQPVWKQVRRTMVYGERPQRALPLTSPPVVAQAAGQAEGPEEGQKAKLSAQLYATKAVQSLENHLDENKKTKIHNIPGAVFSQAMIEMGVRGGDAVDHETSIKTWLARLDEPLKSQLGVLWASAQDDIGAFRDEIEQWFDGQMARLTALYRSQIRLIMLGLGGVVAAVAFSYGLRTDTLELVSDLQRDETLRTALSDLAAQASQQDLAAIAAEGCPPVEGTTPPDDASSTPSTTALDFRCVAKGLESYQNISLIFDGTGSPADSNAVDDGDVTTLRRIVGITITAVAISFGASFWWNVMRRMVGLRRNGQTVPSA